MRIWRRTVPCGSLSGRRNGIAQASGSPRQGGVRGGSKLAGSCLPSIAANASSPQRWMPATGHGRLSRAKKPTALRLERMAAELAAEHPAVEQQRVQRELREAEAQTVEHRDQRDRLHLDAGLLVHLFHRDLRRRVPDVGVADRVQPHAGVGALGEQELALLVADDGGDRDLRA